MSGNSQTVLVFYNMSLIRNLQILNSFFISFNSDLKYLNNMEVKVGFEPTTSGFESQRADQTALLYFIMVGAVGLEPTVLLARDLQSLGVTNFPTHP